LACPWKRQGKFADSSRRTCQSVKTPSPKRQKLIETLLLLFEKAQHLFKKALEE